MSLISSSSSEAITAGESAPALGKRFFPDIGAAAAIAIPAILAAFKYAYDGLNADIILNQLMSLRELTLFYWGQNRLLNVVPFALQGIPWPLANLFLVLLASTLSFFSLVWLIAFAAIKLSDNKIRFPRLFLLYTLQIAICLALFKFKAWVDLCLWHFEYSLAILLGVAGIAAVYAKRYFLRAFGLGAGFIALGINPVIILPLGCFLFFKCLYAKSVKRIDLVLAVSWTCFFLLWISISKQYGSYENYSSLSSALLPEGLEKMAINIISEYLRLWVLLTIAGVILAAGILACAFPARARALAGVLRKPNFRRAAYCTCAALFSCLAIAYLIATIPWYHLNQSAPRYTIPIFYCILLIAALWQNMILDTLEPGRRATVSLAAAIFAISVFFYLPPSFNLAQAIPYRECDSAIPAAARIYAGDYWPIWACVSRDLNNGFESYALGYRSDPERPAIEAKLRQLEMDGDLEIICLKAEVKECERQAQDYLEGALVKSVENLEAGVTVLRLHTREE